MGSAPGLRAATTAVDGPRQEEAGRSTACGSQPPLLPAGPMPRSGTRAGGFPRPFEVSVLTPRSTEEGAGRPPSRL